MTWFHQIHLVLGAVSSFPAVQEAVNRSCEFQLNNFALYYFNAIGHKSSPSYHPTNQDVSAAAA